MKEITAWYVVTKDGNSFNHIEDGWSDKDKPEPKFKEQKSWNGSEWFKEHCYLNEENKVKHMNTETTESEELSMNQKRATLVLTRMLELIKTDPSFADFLVEEPDMDSLLENFQGYDGFGTEAQSDPRGDFRDGEWYMDYVQGIDD